MSQYQNSKNDLSQLIELIESTDSNVSDEAALILRDLLINGDTNCLSFLLEKFVILDSEPVLDVICSIREPLDRILLDKMIDLLRPSPQRCLSIFAQLILKQSTWLYKLPTHPFLGQFLKHLKICDNISFAVGGLLCISGLLPLLPSMSVYLNDYFSVFISLVELLKNKSEWPEIYQIHLKIALFVFFQRLYALYPCNFLRFLRFTFAASNKMSSSENRMLFDCYIRPMLDHVRLHPLLIISTKDEELAKERWMHKEAHDILVECNVIGINIGEGNAVNEPVIRPISSSFSTHSSQQQSLPVSQHETPIKVSNASDNVPSPSPLTFTPVILQSESLRQDAEAQNRQFQQLPTIQNQTDEWSPSVAVGLCTPPSSRSETPLSSAFSDSSSVSLLRSSRTNSVGVDMRRKQQQENKTRKSFGQALGRFFSKPDANRRAQMRNQTPVPQSPMLKEGDKNEFAYPSVGPTSTQTRSAIGRENSAELAEEASEIEAANESLKLNICSGESLTIAAEIAKRLSIEDSRGEDIEVGILTQMHNDSEEKLEKTRHPSSQSSHSRNLSRHSSFLDAPPMFSCSDSTLQSAPVSVESNTGIAQDSENVAGLPFFIGSAPVPTLPRLSNSQSVADFMKRMNRLRFHSQCVTGATATDGNNQEISPAVENSDQVVEPQTIKLQPKRPRSCPVRADTAIESSTPLKTPDVTSRRESNQGPSGVNAAENQKSFTTNRSATEERSFTFESAGSFEYPLLKLVKMFYPVVESFKVRGSSAAEISSTYENFDDYLLTSRLSHDWEVVQKTDKISSSKMELEQLRTTIALLKHQLFYERHKKVLHAERNRRLYGRLKQTSALEEQNLAQKDQLRLQEIEIQQLVQALSDARRGNVEARNDFVDKESVMTNRLQILSKERNEFATKLELKLHELSSVLEKNHLLFKELSSCKQHLFNATSQLEMYAKETEKAPSSNLSSDMLTREALLVAEINNRLRSKLKVCQEYETSIAFLQEKIKDYESTTKKETNDIRRTLKKEKNRADASANKVAELEGQLHKRHQQLSESKRQLDEAREVHLEQIKASQMKFRSLVSVCQRQESHILELYQQLEHLNLRDNYNTSRSGYDGSVSAKNSVAGAAREGSFCEGVRIPSRQGAKEIMSYDSDVYAGHGSSCGSENMFLPFLFERRSVPQRTTSNVDEVDDEVVYAS